MENEIRSLYKRLTNKELENTDSVINREAFSSVLLDRFTSELHKFNISWDQQPTSISQLLSQNNGDRIINKSSKLQNILDITDHVTVNGGIGIDLQHIGDFFIVEDIWEDSFYKENFSNTEIGHALKKNNPYETLAGIFAAKEAIFKATGIDRKKIAITFTEAGKPIYKSILVSISHDKDYCTAVAYNQPIQQEKNPSNDNEVEVQQMKSENLQRPTKINILFLLLLGVIIGYIIYKEYSKLYL